MKFGNKVRWLTTEKGISLKWNKTNPLTLASFSLGKENVDFSEVDLKNYSKITIDFLSSIFNFENKIKPLNVIDESPVFNLRDFEILNPEYLYKYVSKNSASYYQKGIFQVGSTGYFRTMENLKARDELEGLAFVSCLTNNRVANSIIYLGFNHYIFCCTDQNNNELSEYHISNFGSVLLKIKTEPFLRKMAKRLGATSYKIIRVKYANAKLIQSQTSVDLTPELSSNFSSNQMQTLFMNMISECTTPCLALKPKWFSPENEIRIIFELPYNVNENIPRRFENKSLVKYIDFIV